MGYVFSSNFGGIFVSSVVSEEVYDPVFDTPIDANFIYQLLPSFYRDLMDDKEIFTTYWSGLMQQTAADMLNLWQIDYGKSLRDVPVISQRKWFGLDFVREYAFDVDPGVSFGGSGNLYLNWISPNLVGTYTNRSRFDSAYYPLKRFINDQASLYFSVDVRVSAADISSAALWGYFKETVPGQLADFFGVALLNSEVDRNAPRPSLLYVDGAGVPTVSITPYTLSLNTDYRLNFNYTSGTTVAVLEVVELRYLKTSGTSGKTLGEVGDTLTNFFVDDSVNFDTLGIVAGDILVVFGLDYEILSVDGSQLTTKTIGLPVDVDNVSYEVRGPFVVSTSSLDLQGDAPDPFFKSTKFGTGNLDLRSTTLAVFSNLSVLKNKTMMLTSWNWKFLDPSFDEIVLSLPRVQDIITAPVLTLTEGTDYYVKGSTVFFQEPPEEGLWAEYVGYDEGVIQSNFGSNVDLFGESSDQYKARVRGLYYAYWQGPTLYAVRQGVHILVGLPIAEKAGTVEAINTSFSGILGVVTVGGVDYLYPLLAGTTLSVGDVVDTFAPLCGGVEIVDYVTDPEWFVDLNFNEMKKFHTFGVRLNIDAFTLDTLGLAATFVDRIKPTWKDYLFIVYKNLEDDVVIADDIALKVTLKLYDQPCDHIVIAYDSVEYEGEEADWKYDQGIGQWDATSAGMRASATQLIGTAVFTNGSTSVVGSGTSWLIDIGVGVVVGKNIAVGLYTTGAALETTASSNELYDPLAGFGGIEVGDAITITGEGTFEVIAVTDASNITVDAPMFNTATSVAWYNIGKLKLWANVASVASNTALTLSLYYPFTTGTFVVALLDNDYKRIFYDAFTEECPDEEFVINITYTGVSPPVGPVTVPAPTGTTTHTFTATNEVYSVTLAELVP